MNRETSQEIVDCKTRGVTHICAPSTTECLKGIFVALLGNLVNRSKKYVDSLTLCYYLTRVLSHRSELHQLSTRVYSFIS